MTDNPAISVLLPVYNGGAYLGRAIESILNQTFTDFEFIIINDGSKDGSKQLIDQYALKDSRIVAVHQENAGLIATLNRGIALAKAPLIARMDADDIAFPERFADQYKFMQNHPQIVLVGSSIRLIDEQDKPIRDVPYPATPQEVAKEMLRGSPIAHPTVMMRKSIIEQEGGYNPLYKHMEDYDLWLRLSEKYQLANLPEVYLLYRQHPEKVSFVHSRDATLRTFVAQLASKERRAGRPDPVKDLQEITPETLDLFNISSKEKARLLFLTLEYTLNAHIFSNDEKPILEIIAQAREMAKTNRQRRFLSLVLQKAALFYVTNRDFKQVLLLMLQAFWLSPMAVIQTSLRLTKKIIKYAIRKTFRS